MYYDTKSQRCKNGLRRLCFLQINTRPPTCPLDLPEWIFDRRPLAVELVYAPPVTPLLAKVRGPRPELTKHSSYLTCLQHAEAVEVQDA